jgi:hypothetical protein
MLTSLSPQTRYNKHMNKVYNGWAVWGVCILSLFAALVFMPSIVNAINVSEYKDTISDSGPSESANHTIEFVVKTDLSPGSVIEITPPPGFTVLSTSTFGIRNVELRVDGSTRTSGATAASGIDGVQITAGTPGFFRYTLASDSGISSGSRLQFRIGNHTAMALQPVTTFSTSTGTTTSPGDIEPIVNSADLGRHDLKVEIYDGSLVANANPVIFLNEKVSLPNIDTTEEIPPFRFNGSPTSTIGGTTLNVEISLETDEFSVCKYALSADTAYSAMGNVFANTGQIYHSTVVSVTPDSVASFYVRCIDDEGNLNITDYLIQFTVNDQPTGTSNTDGDVEGSGTGSGNDGTGTGGGAGGSTGVGGGEESTEGSTSGSGGSGGGGGGGSGGSSGSSGGGGFESTDGPFQSGDARIIVSGYAYPDAEVTILADGQRVDTVDANGDGRYSITIDGIARGAYTFGVYATDQNDVKSSTFSTSFTVTGARTSALSNINVVPSIAVSPDPVDPGQTLSVTGYSLPNATVTIENGRSGSIGGTPIEVQSGSDGEWSTTINTSSFVQDTYQIRAKAEQTDGRSTVFSNYTFYGVGQEADQPINADLNRDGDVNLIDFSILLFWWGGDGGDSSPPADINQDGNVSLTDFSILLFNWTG